MKYRPDVDGLRAVAVILVLMFHSQIGFSGGYIGVDVFFVISGYLITGLILKEQAMSRFSLSAFWARRIRRILPASVLVVVVTFIASVFLLFPTDLIAFANSTISQQLMLSNVFFWRNTGYFDGRSELMPLLHTWSLAVEEQFYCIYPLILIALRRVELRTKFVLLFGATTLMFVLCEVAVGYDQVATFYLLPTRSWELLLGGVVFLSPSRLAGNRFLMEIISLCGACTVAVCAIAFNANTRFPGLAALAPCVATGAVIYSNQVQHTLIGTLLALRPVVFVGLISYSLYLWHWPILAFANYWLDPEYSLTSRVFLLLLAFILAIVTWRFVERPVRFNRKLPTATLVSVLVTAAIALIAASLFIRWGDGIPERFDANVRQMLAAADLPNGSVEMSVEEIRLRQIPRFGDVDGAMLCVVWGDSHAMSLVPGIDEACRQVGVAGEQLTRSSTPPVLKLVTSKKPDAAVFSQEALEHISSSPAHIVFLIAAWSRYAKYPGFENGLRETIERLESKGKQVVIVLDVALMDVDVPHELARRAVLRMDTLGLGKQIEDHNRENRAANEAIVRCVSSATLIVDPKTMFVGVDQFGIWPVAQGDTVFYRDQGHLTVAGAHRLVPLFQECIRLSIR